MGSAASGASASTANVTYQRPSGSRETTTVVGSNAVMSTLSKDHTNRSGVLVFARFSTPSRSRNAERV
ncbi:hypothetical protein BBK82_25045 [Lentzea guizhouensis]|uniref:Uncharacterized protein n=1 Tax=Lentzea guizhouensis TaxID=1586287 RepID=A0A1B2HM86_9PSEU|nr:hypothetical protein BBK82_25045 [Lentzea guizhouensis]